MPNLILDKLNLMPALLPYGFVKYFFWSCHLILSERF